MTPERLPSTYTLFFLLYDTPAEAMPKLFVLSSL